jgi:hypothetical protein
MKVHCRARDAILGGMENPLELQAQRINRWLRYHTDYQVQINFLSLYACIDVRIERKETLVKSWIGSTLEKRLDEVIRFLHIEDWEKQGACYEKTT